MISLIILLASAICQQKQARQVFMDSNFKGRFSDRKAEQD